MKTIYFIIITAIAFCFGSCSNSATEKAQSAVKRYLKENLKNSESYEPISFTQLDTLKQPDTSDTKLVSLYKITHFYIINNSDKEKAKMTVSFYLDKDLKVNKTNTKSINGDYGTLTGNAYWKYNNYVGNKADAGAEITLYSLDTIRGNLKFDATADVQGYYKIEKLLPGSYLLIVRSKNATDCPDIHLSNLSIYRDEIKQLFGFDIEKYKTQLNEINVLDSLYFKSSDNFPSNGSLSQMTASIAKTDAISKQRTEKIEKLFEAFPDDFKIKIKLYTGYSNAYDFSTIRIEENKTENIVTDFGITCI
jgi:hypothetical protein